MILIPEGERANAHTLAAVFSLWSWRAPSGDRMIDARLVNSWYDRREVTGFPEIAERKVGGRQLREWCLFEALVWYLAWTPGKAGAPPGNSNALTHGRYVGRRAEREARRTGM